MAAPEPSFTAQVCATVAAIPAGTVLTYGEVAAEVGAPRAARAVARVLATTDVPLPWWRVVPASGRLPAHLVAEQSRRLRAEGLRVDGGRLALARVAPPRPRQAP